MPPSRLGQLALEEKLGDHPSQSSVHRAIHVELKRTVAVKVFNVPFGATPEARRDFSNEWTQLQAVSHPAIAKCYGGGFENQDAYLAYELVEGDTLSALLEQKSRLPWETVLDVADAVCDALDFLHSQNIIHERIEPSKLMIAGISPILLDVRVNRGESMFTTGNALTPQLAALQPPEILDGSQKPSPASDLYSLGATLYWLLTGRPLHEGDDVETVTQHVCGDASLVAASSIVLDVPVWLDKVLEKLLARDPAKRTPSAKALKLQLTEARKRSLSRTSVAEATSTGFSPLNEDNQSEREAVRKLLGREPVSFQDEIEHDDTSWLDKTSILVLGLVAIIGLVTYLCWPLSEEQMKRKAEAMLAQQTRSSLTNARSRYLEPMLKKFPDGEHATWASEQIELIEMTQAENAINTKVKRNFPFDNEGERLYAEARGFEKFGDRATALDRYRSMVVLLNDDPDYRVYVNLARRQIANLKQESDSAGSAVEALIRKKLDDADQLYADGKVLKAREVWYSLIELYKGNAEVEPLLRTAQERLASDGEANDSNSPSGGS